MISLITVVSTTYAFIILNDEAKVSEIDFEIENQDGLLLSLDGVNYYQDISYEKIAKAIIEAQGGTYTADVDNVLDNFNISGVQMATNGAEVAKGVGAKGATVSFVQDSLKKVQDPNTPALNDEWYEHQMVEATQFSYITFDLWCKVETNAMSEAELEKGYELYFSTRTALTGSKQTVSLVNSLTTQTEEMEAGKELEVEPINAMRIAVLDRETEDLLIFEPYEGLGSSAVEGRTGANDPSKNAMYTYYNNTHPLSPFVSAAEENEQFDTVVGLAALTTTKLGVFKYTPNPDNKDINDNFNVVKLTVMIYMDGWDADYFMGINETNLKVKLGFEIKPVN
jgi:hypothetical protein